MVQESDRRAAIRTDAQQGRCCADALCGPRARSAESGGAVRREAEAGTALPSPETESGAVF